jgi:membrane fusion protein, heavy metal efflux system
MRLLLNTTLSLLLVGLLLGCTRGKAADAAANSEPHKESTKELRVPASQQAGVIESMTLKPSETPDVLRVPGKVMLPDNGNWRVGAMAPGRIEHVYVSQGDFVKAGQVLARMHSHDVHETKAAYLTAVAEKARLQAALTLAQRNFERTQRLYAMKAASLEETETARQQLLDAQTALRSGEYMVEREKTHLEDGLGISVDKLDSKDEGADLVPVLSPASAYVLEKKVTPGSVVDPSTDLFMLGEIHHLWLIASLREENLGKIKTGQLANIHVTGMPNLDLKGRVTNVGEQFDPMTHTMKVRVEFDNPGNRLRPEMLAEAEIPVGAPRPALLVPADAVQQVNGQDVVFVRTGQETFAIRPIRAGQQVGTMIPVLEGLQSGENVVVRGSFILKSQLLKSSMEGE